MGLVLFPTSILWDSGYFECPQTGIVLNSCVHSTGSILSFLIGKFTIKGNHTKYTAEQRKAAVQYYIEHGRSVGKTIKALGYPKKTLLCQWLKEDLTPNQRK